MMDSARLMARLGAPFRVSASPVSSGVTTQSECIMVIDRDTENVFVAVWISHELGL